MVERLERAEKKRVSHLQERIRKAQEEDVKVITEYHYNLIATNRL